MKPSVTLAGFGLGLAGVFAAAMAVGAAVGPLDLVAGDDERGGLYPDHRDVAVGEHQDGHAPAGGHRTNEAGATDELPGGLLIAQGGYTLDLERTQLPAERRGQVRFQILGPDAEPLIRYTAAHGRDLHLILVRRDMTRFQDVHPRLRSDGSWAATVDLSATGAYRLFADFIPAGQAQGLTLGADLSVPGDYHPRALPPPTAGDEVDGYELAVEGALVPGEESKLTFSVAQDGRPVTDLQPYLRAYGHLVALREGDLAYLHVHPADAAGDGTTSPGPEVSFYATAPSPGSYRLFLDFRHAGRVRTAEFTAVAEAR